MKDTASLVGSLIGLDKWATNLKVKLYPEGTHWVMVAQPQQVAQDMRNFFTDDKTFPKESVYRGK